MSRRYHEHRLDTATTTQGRRRFLKGCVLALPALSLHPAQALTGPSKRRLSFHHTHTNEKLSVVYHDGQRYLPESLRRIDHFLRDFRSKEIHPIDPRLLDILYTVTLNTGAQGRFEVISGYRSPTTNAMLRTKSSGVAKKSLHMQGKAIDVRLSGVDCGTLRTCAVKLKQGGVGYYPRSDFVHLDTGRYRTW